MTGGHYIILLCNDFEDYLVVNPGRHHLFVEQHAKEKIIQACQNFGSWIISIDCSFKMIKKVI